MTPLSFLASRSQSLMQRMHETQADLFALNVEVSMALVGQDAAHFPHLLHADVGCGTSLVPSSFL